MREIIRYDNRKLYDKTNRQYISLKNLVEVVKAGEKIRVTKHKTDKDITYQTLVKVLSCKLENTSRTNESIEGLIINS